MGAETSCTRCVPSRENHVSRFDSDGLLAAKDSSQASFDDDEDDDGNDDEYHDEEVVLCCSRVSKRTQKDGRVERTASILSRVDETADCEHVEAVHSFDERVSPLKTDCSTDDGAALSHDDSGSPDPQLQRLRDDHDNMDESSGLTDTSPQSAAEANQFGIPFFESPSPLPSEALVEVVSTSNTEIQLELFFEAEFQNWPAEEQRRDDWEQSKGGIDGEGGRGRGDGDRDHWSRKTDWKAGWCRDNHGQWHQAEEDGNGNKDECRRSWDPSPSKHDANERLHAIGSGPFPDEEVPTPEVGTTVSAEADHSTQELPKMPRKATLAHSKPEMGTTVIAEAEDIPRELTMVPPKAPPVHLRPEVGTAVVAEAEDVTRELPRMPPKAPPAHLNRPQPKRPPRELPRVPPKAPPAHFNRPQPKRPPPEAPKAPPPAVPKAPPKEMEIEPNDNATLLPGSERNQNYQDVFLSNLENPSENSNEEKKVHPDDEVRIAYVYNGFLGFLDGDHDLAMQALSESTLVENNACEKGKPMESKAGEPVEELPRHKVQESNLEGVTNKTASPATDATAYGQPAAALQVAEIDIRLLSDNRRLYSEEKDNMRADHVSNNGKRTEDDAPKAVTVENGRLELRGTDLAARRKNDPCFSKCRTSWKSKDGVDESFILELSNLLRNNRPRRNAPVRIDAFAHMEDVKKAQQCEDEGIKRLVSFSCKSGHPRFEMAGEEFIRATAKHRISVDPKWMLTSPNSCLANDLELAVCEGGREGGRSAGVELGRGGRDQDRCNNQHDDWEQSAGGNDGGGGRGRDERDRDQWSNHNDSGEEGHCGSDTWSNRNNSWSDQKNDWQRGWHQNNYGRWHREEVGSRGFSPSKLVSKEQQPDAGSSHMPDDVSLMLEAGIPAVAESENLQSSVEDTAMSKCGEGIAAAGEKGEPVNEFARDMLIHSSIGQAWESWVQAIATDERNATLQKESKFLSEERSVGILSSASSSTTAIAENNAEDAVMSIGGHILRKKKAEHSVKVASVAGNGRNHQDYLVAESAKLARELEEQDLREQKLQRHLANSRREIEELRQQIRERDTKILKLNHEHALLSDEHWTKSEIHVVDGV